MTNRMLSEAEFAEAVTWALCAEASGAGKGGCDPYGHCVCGGEGRFVANHLYGKGLRVFEPADGGEDQKR